MSPRTKLLNNKPLADKVRDMVDGEVFDTAADAALLQYIEELPSVDSMDRYAIKAAQIDGAKGFLKLFRRIADATTPRQKAGLPDNLDFKA